MLAESTIRTVVKLNLPIEEKKMSKKILVINDDEGMCEEMAEILEDEGYCVNTSFSGYEGKNLIEKNDYDIILLDLKLPGLQGLEILKNIREKNIKSKVIVMTGKPLNTGLFKEEVYYEDQKECITELSDALITKPFDIEKLLGKIKELVEKESD
jgi:DNA-binding response OmpR family regulator